VKYFLKLRRTEVNNNNKKKNTSKGDTAKTRKLPR